MLSGCWSSRSRVRARPPRCDYPHAWWSANRAAGETHYPARKEDLSSPEAFRRSLRKPGQAPSRSSARPLQLAIAESEKGGSDVHTRRPDVGSDAARPGADWFYRAVSTGGSDADFRPDDYSADSDSGFR